MYNQAQKPGSINADKTVLLFYRHVEGEPTNAWTEAARFVVPKIKGDLGTIPATIKPNGTWLLGDDENQTAWIWFGFKTIEKEKPMK